MTFSSAAYQSDSFSYARAHWIRRDTILWAAAGWPGCSYALLVGAESRCSLTSAQPDLHGVSTYFPHLVGIPALLLAAADLPLVPDLLRGPLAVAAFGPDGTLLDVTRLQIPGVLDDLFPYTGPLGVTFTAGVPTLSLWAPTAQKVTLARYPRLAEPALLSPMQRDEASGVWHVLGAPDWIGHYYRYQVEVYLPSVDQVVMNEVTDPYALSLSLNSGYSQIVSLDDPALKPVGWDTLVKPTLAHPTDMVLYELHLRDFSSFDQSVPLALRGTYTAFTLPNTAGVRHLRRIAEAGVTHLQLMPLSDFASVEEDRQQQLPLPLAHLQMLPPDSAEQQALIHSLRGRDAYNWGYDPFHPMVPEGSYSTDPNGPRRIVEFREMVQALNQMGLRLVMDVVYNHTYASGQHPQSLLDRIVPGYYYRLSADGEICTSTCCPNTATEHAMMERLMCDSVLLWARAYKVDGFRFDLMGHHMRRNMLRVRAALDALTLEDDGVDGKSICLYGEGWDFGEVARGVRGANATQLNMAGSGIGTFSDRLRDAVRGSSFGDLREQGFVTGLFSDPNESYQHDAWSQRAHLIYLADLIKLGLAGNLQYYSFLTASGECRTGAEIPYGNSVAGYTAQPQEQIVYVSAHDNETLFDAIQLKVAVALPMADRARMQLLALSFVAFAQGIPFFHAADELLRSKSLNRNSYNSSDWFNQIDWTGQSNAFGIGLPPASDNVANWPLIGSLLANPRLKPTSEAMAFCYDGFLDLLRIRRTTSLFRLRSADAIMRAVRFLNNGPEQIPGLIVMRIRNPDLPGAHYSEVVVLFNATPNTITYSEPTFIGAALSLHPLQQASTDPSLHMARFIPAEGAFSLPARTTLVFVGDDVA